MPKAAPSEARRAAYRQRLVSALVSVCRKVARMEQRGPAAAACKDVIEWLRAMPKVRRRRR